MFLEHEPCPECGRDPEECICVPSDTDDYMGEDDYDNDDLFYDEEPLPVYDDEDIDDLLDDFEDVDFDDDFDFEDDEDDEGDD